MTPPPAPPRLWLLTGDMPTGPFDLSAVHARLAAGTTGWDTPACAVGESVWRPLRDHPALGLPAAPPPAPPPEPARPTPPPVLYPVAPRQPAETLGDAVRRPWNPTALAWLTLLFTPVWGGVMAAVNGRRAGHRGSAGAGLVIGLGSTAANFAAGAVWVLPYWAELAWYLGTVFALWAVCFRPQREAYARIAVADYRARAGGGWGLPTAAGTPLALVAVLVFVVAPLVPPGPRQVCEAFAAAGTAAEAAETVSAALRPALPGLFAARSAADPADAVELTDEAEAPADVGGYLVGFETRLRVGDGGGPVRVGGAFLLRDHGGAWKIDDLVFTAEEGQPVDPPVSLAASYQTLFAPPPPAPAARPRVLPVPRFAPPEARPAPRVAAAPASWWTPKRVRGGLAGGAVAVWAVVQGAWQWATGRKAADPAAEGAAGGR